MQLLGSLTSPYVRLVRVLLAEKGLADEVELVLTNPMADSPELRAANPLGKVPALVNTPVGTLFDSRLICEFLDAWHPHPSLIPSHGSERWDCLQRVVLAQGLMDAAVATVFERGRPEANQSPLWLQRWDTAMDAALQQISQQDLDPAATDLGRATTAVALGYLDFRHPHKLWRDHYPALAAWADTWMARPSMQTTQPPKDA
nr:glutathione S-transferase N-terminal domain-containing protein [Oceanococcus sp. HetDA_MAG_MS8]